MGNTSVSLENQLKDFDSAIKKQISTAKDSATLQQIKSDLTDKKSILAVILAQIKDLSVDEKKKIGKLANELKVKVNENLEKKLQDLKIKELVSTEALEHEDVTLPGKIKTVGHRHIITETIWRCEDIFQKMGFEIEYPNEIDDDFHNFESVNIPKDHPARDAWDTFWTKNGYLAITHTSSMQNRVITARKPPIRVVVPGRCFRNEATDARHEHTFNQIEGIYIDKQVTLANMLGTLKTFFEAYYERQLEVKFTPDYFPFVEPGGMMSLTCIICDGKGCAVCKKSGWLELLGCGMIHSNVLEKAGVDPAVYSGFAWGFGVERLIMLKYTIEDIRHFHNGNLDFIQQF